MITNRAFSNSSIDWGCNAATWINLADKLRMESWEVRNINTKYYVRRCRAWHESFNPRPDGYSNITNPPAVSFAHCHFSSFDQRCCDRPQTEMLDLQGVIKVMMLTSVPYVDLSKTRRQLQWLLDSAQ